MSAYTNPPFSIYTQSSKNLFGVKTVARSSSVETKKLQLTVDAATDRIVGEIAALGIHGTSKSEVACSILRMWLWDNHSKLRESGIELKSSK